MYTSEGAPDFVADQGMYYPVDANYGYYCTGNKILGGINYYPHGL